MTSTQTAVLGAGCFWCLDAVFRQMRGVIEVESGYCGGHVDAPDYHAVCGGRSGHAEVVRLRFDPAQVSYQQLLEVFFTLHNPTTPNRQGSDVGKQYRSVIFAQDAQQFAIARAFIDALEASQTFGAPIVTELLEAQPFWPAEDYHQDYFANHRGQPYCHFVVTQKLEKFRKHFGPLTSA